MNKTQVYDYYGGASKAAEALGLAQSSVSSWGDIVPVVTALRVFAETKGEVKFRKSDYTAPEDLRLLSSLWGPISVGIQRERND